MVSKSNPAHLLLSFGPQAKNDIHVNKRLGKKKNPEEYFMTHKNCMKIKFQCPWIKFYCNTAKLIHLHSVYGCSHATKSRGE